MMKPEDRKKGGREAGRVGRGEGDCVSKCGCLEIGLPPCQKIKMFPLTFIFPLSGILPMYDEPSVNERRFTDGHIGNDLSNGWRRHLGRGDPVTGISIFNTHTFQEFHFLHSNGNVNLQ